MSETPLTPTLDTTRRAIIDVLVKNRVIGAREAVDRLIAAVREATLREALRVLSKGSIEEIAAMLAAFTPAEPPLACRECGYPADHPLHFSSHQAFHSFHGVEPTVPAKVQP